MRKSANEIPKFEELKKIISLESPRNLQNKKLYNKYFNLTPICQLLSFFGIPNRFDEIEKTSEYLIWSANAKQEVIDKMLSLTRIPSELLLVFNALYSNLSTEDMLPNNFVADTIFVFGSASTLRIQKAVELYNSGSGKTITISGKKPFYKDSNKTEADALANFAIGQGIPREKLIVENKAISLPDNVNSTLALWRKLNFSVTSLIIVSSPFAMARSFSQWLKYPEKDLQIFRQNSSVSEKYNQDNWYKTTDGLNIVLNEYFKLYGEYLVDISLVKFGEIR